MSRPRRRSSRIETPRRETIADRLRAAGCVLAEDEADLVIEQAASAQQLEEMVRRRVDGIPLEYILGWAEFDGIRMSVEPGVFVPRHRTRFLVERAAAVARQSLARGLPRPLGRGTAGEAPAGRPRGPVLLDLCCGVGSIAAAISARVPGLEVYASELDPVAVRCARRNLGGAGDVFEGDLYDPLPETLRHRVDLLVANAPYVPTSAIALMPPEAREHEAPAALDGGSDGLDVQRRIAASARQWLAASGRLIIETSERQAPGTAAILSRAGLRTRIRHSDEHDATIVVGRAPLPGDRCPVIGDGSR